MYSTGEMARKLNRSVRTLQIWDKKGILTARRTPSDRRYYTHDQYLEYIGKSEKSKKINIVYYRVSSQSQKPDMENQRKALELFCRNAGVPIHLWLSDIGSGLNYKRKNFLNIFKKIENGEVDKIIIAHKDRLVRFGYEWFEGFCKEHGAEIIIINGESLSPEEEMVKDLMTIIHCFSSRLYGLRNYKRKIKDVISKKD